MHDALAGRIVTCEDTRLAVERQRRDRQRAESDPSWPYIWSPQHSAAACLFIESLPHVTGKWDSPLIVLEASQCFEVSTFFGWRHRADRARRRFTVKYKETARKSAKTTLDVAIALFHVAEEQEQGAEVVFGVILGTGVGGGIVVGGRLLAGANAVAGEWGHNPLPALLPQELPGPSCYCGRSGCVETFLSGPGLAADHRRGTGRLLTGPEIAAGADAGDPECRATLDRYADRLARALVSDVDDVADAGEQRQHDQPGKQATHCDPPLLNVRTPCRARCR